MKRQIKVWKKRHAILLLSALTAGLVMVPRQSEAFPWIIIKAAVKKVLKAIDLRIQELQNKTIALQDAQKALENELSRTKLTEIAQWAEKQRNLYRDYYEELWKVKNKINTYQRAKGILKQQLELVKEYKQAYGIFIHDNHFTPEELAYMYQVYSGIVKESMANTDELMLVVNSFATQMSDGKRLELIDRISQKMDNNLKILRDFNRQNEQINLKRSGDLQEMESVKKLYGLQ